MKKDKFNAKLREYSKTLSPKSGEQNLVNNVYEAFNTLFGINNCIQIGSYPRYTAVTPVHDLDVLYFLGPWSESNRSPATTLQNLLTEISTHYLNPTPYTAKPFLQTHSVTVDFMQGAEVILSVDVVPAYTFGKNEFNQDMYKVPEVTNERSHAKRKEIYAKMEYEHRDMAWINSDPRGYIQVASNVGQNSDFRKSVKFAKRWKSNLCAADNTLKLKSFHVEQVITQIFQRNPNIEIFDAIFAFFYELPTVISFANQIVDRANVDKYIDDYLAKFTPAQVEKITKARDGFLIKLEQLKEADSVEKILQTAFYERSRGEKFLFDNKVSTLLDPQHSDFALSADVADKQGNVTRRLNPSGVIDSGRYLKFNKSKNIMGCRYDWKVKNDNTCSEPRGEITHDKPKNVPEHTRYRGAHYVECYAIEGNVCVASARHNIAMA